MPGAAAVELMDTSSLEIIAPVADVWAGVVAGGMRAAADLDGGPCGLDAAVKAVSDAIDPVSRAFSVKLQAANPDLKLKAGMFARVRIVYNEVEALAVPASALLEDATGSYVAVYENGLALRRRVRVGIRADDGYFEIAEGVSAQDVVIFEGNFGLPDRARVVLVGGDSR
jgi:membrane fusion protein (multidrug efflux system)